MERELLRAYLLGNLDDNERARIDALLVESEETRAALEAEQAALGAMPGEDPPFAPATREMAIYLARKRMARAERRRSVLAGCAISLLTAFFAAVFILPIFGRAHEGPRSRHTVANNLKMMGLVFKMYANETPGAYYPPAAPYPDLLTLDLKAVWPEYLTDPMVLFAKEQTTPEERETLSNFFHKTPVDWRKCSEIAADNLVYLPWIARQESDLVAMISAHKNMALADLDKPLFVEGRRLPQLNENMETSFWRTAGSPAESALLMSKIPVLMQREYEAGGVRQVLYMDGHVAAAHYGEFPCTKAIDEALGIISPSGYRVKKPWSCSRER